jgi:hypothetical protein
MAGNDIGVLLIIFVLGFSFLGRFLSYWHIHWYDSFLQRFAFFPALVTDRVLQLYNCHVNHFFRSLMSKSPRRIRNIIKCHNNVTLHTSQPILSASACHP